MDDKALFERLDKIILLLETVAKQPSLLIRLFNGIAMGAGILGILSAVDVIKGINTAGQSPAPAACGGFPQQSCGVLNPSFPHSLDHARASTVAISLRSSIKTWLGG